jgi:thiol:disulfide interchange protein
MKVITTFFLVFLTSSASSEVFKCMENGKTVFTDKPCDGQIVEFDSLNSMVSVKPNLTNSSKSSRNNHYKNTSWLHGYTGYKKALRLQKKYHAPIFLYFQADWCGYCRRLESELLHTKKGIKVLKKAIKVKITPDNSTLDKDFFKSLGGTGYPSIYLQPVIINKPKKISTTSKKRKGKVLSANELSNIISL